MHAAVRESDAETASAHSANAPHHCARERGSRGGIYTTVDVRQQPLWRREYTVMRCNGFRMNLRRHRRAVTSLILGAWLFALFVGIANACLPEAVDTMQTAGMAMGPGQDGDESQSAGCQQFCSIDTPLFTKLQLVQDQPAGQPLLVTSISTLLSPVPASAVPVVYLAHPPPDVPILLRSLRLAL